jgi:uncharacterized protein (UPF0335 family)
MSFLDRVNAELKKAAGTGWTAVRDSAKIGKLRYKKHNLHKDAGKLFAELGGVVYDLAGSPDENPLSRPEVLKLIEDIKRVEQESSTLEEEIAETKKKEPEEQEKASQTAEKSEEDKGGGEE